MRRWVKREAGLNFMAKKLEEFFPTVLPNTYEIYSEGGWHPWKNVPEAASIYREKVWPYIRRVHWPTNNNDRASKWKEENRAEQMNPSISFRHIYPYMCLQSTKRYIAKAKNKAPQEGYGPVTVLMHIAVARAFVPNPEKKVQACHINDDPSNYLRYNLKWGTNRENHTGRDADSKMSYSSLHTIFKMRGWAKG